MNRRPESGTMQFGDDWCGYFLRGDDAMHVAMLITNALAGDPLAITALRTHGDALRTVSMVDQPTTFLRPFGECLADKENENE